MCYRDDYAFDDFGRNRRCGCGRDRFVCDCRKVRRRRHDRHDHCNCHHCRRRRNEFVCRCWER